jgi:hypothetical protein
LGCGVSFTGVVADASVCDVTAIIGWLNVTLSSGASGTLPSGIQRTTRRSWPASLAGGGSSDDGGGGNAPLIVWPVRAAAGTRAQRERPLVVGILLMAWRAGAAPALGGELLAGEPGAIERSGPACRSTPGARGPAAGPVWIST